MRVERVIVLVLGLLACGGCLLSTQPDPPGVLARIAQVFARRGCMAVVDVGGWRIDSRVVFFRQLRGRRLRVIGGPRAILVCLYR